MNQVDLAYLSAEMVPDLKNVAFSAAEDTFFTKFREKLCLSN